MAAAEDYHPKQTVDPEVKVADEDATGQDQPAFSGPALALVMMGLGLTVFLIALDTSIVATVFTNTSQGRNQTDMNFLASRPSRLSQSTFILPRTSVGMALATS